MIELQDLQNLNELQIVDLLLEQKAQPFEIYIPKSTRMFFSKREDIAIDYAKLAYAGQRLSDISIFFEYEEVTPEDRESILFRVKAQDVVKLGETLLEISYGYINDPEDDQFVYAELVEEFLGKVESAQISPSCPYFIEVYREFLTEEKD